MNNLLLLMAVKTSDGDELPDLSSGLIFALFIALFAFMFLLYSAESALQRLLEYLSI